MLFYFVLTLLFQNCVYGGDHDDRIIEIFTEGPNGELPPGFVRETNPDWMDDLLMLQSGIPPSVVYNPTFLQWKKDRREGRIPKNMLMAPAPVKPEDFPFLVTVYGGKLFCGGAMIRTSWVLTAAHCIHSKVLDKSGKVKVRAGFTSPKDLIQERISAKLIVHKKYNDKDLNSGYDIGLIRVDTPFKETKTLKVIPLAGSGVAKKCLFGRVCGIGNESLISTNAQTMSYESAIKRPLRCVDLLMDNGTTCRGITNAPSSIKSTLLFTRGMRTTCQGDSGGPLLCQNTVIGVISKQGPCGGTTITCQTYTKVEEFFDFLGENIDGFVAPKSEDSKNQSKAGKKSDAEGIVHARVWALCFVPWFIAFLLN